MCINAILYKINNMSEGLRIRKERISEEDQKSLDSQIAGEILNIAKEMRGLGYGLLPDKTPAFNAYMQEKKDLVRVAAADYANVPLDFIYKNGGAMISECYPGTHSRNTLAALEKFNFEAAMDSSNFRFWYNVIGILEIVGRYKLSLNTVILP